MICGGAWAEGVGGELIRILFDMEKPVRETLSHPSRVQEHTLISIPMAVAAKPSTGSQHEGCLLMAAVCNVHAQVSCIVKGWVTRQPEDCGCI